MHSPSTEKTSRACADWFSGITFSEFSSSIYVHSPRCRTVSRNGLQTLKRQTQRNCTAFSRCTMTLLRRRGFWHVLHMSVTCPVRLTCTMCFRWMSAEDWSMSPCQSRHAGMRLRVVPASASHASQPKRTPRHATSESRSGNQCESAEMGLQTDTSWPSWPSSSSSSSECGKSSGETKPVPVTHCHGNMFDPNSVLLQYVSRFLLKHSWASSRKTNLTGPTAAKDIQKFPRWLHHSSPTKP